MSPAKVGTKDVDCNPKASDCNLTGVSAVAHVASVLSLDSDPNKVIPQVIGGAINAIEAAAKEPSVKRFVYTSSSRAISAPKPNVEFEYNEKGWNLEEVEEAWKPPPYESERAWAVYGASKTQAEQAIWKFVVEKEPSFVVNAILPNANFGEILSDKQPASTAAWVKTIYNGELDPLEGIPPQWMVNVKDVARLHLSALIDPDVENERLLAFAYPYNWNDILASLRRLYPGKTFPENVPDLPRDLSTPDNTRGAQLLKAHGRDGWTSLEESVKDNTAGLR